MMRQAGRYQASYRAVRQKVGFLELCRSPELIAQVTVAPIDEFGFDAAILFSDILVHLPAMGLDLSFEKGEKGKGDGGPKIANPVRTRADVDALTRPRSGEGPPLRARRRPGHQRRALAGRVPLIGFVGGPFTVASYAVEGGSQGFTRLKTMLYADPAAAHALFEKLTQAAIVQIEAQIDAGCRGGPDLRELARRARPRGPRAVRLPVPRPHRRGGPQDRRPLHLLRRPASPATSSGSPSSATTWSRSTGASPSTRRAARAPSVAIQGNLDSTVCSLGPVETAVERRSASCGRPGRRPVTSSTWATASRWGRRSRTVKAVVDAVHAFSWK